jgi:hypothetical protein
LRRVSPSDAFVTVSKKELSRMSEKELRDFARSVGISIDMCDTKDHVMTRVLLSCQEFTNY